MIEKKLVLRFCKCPSVPCVRNCVRQATTINLALENSTRAILFLPPSSFPLFPLSFLPFRLQPYSCFLVERFSSKQLHRTRFIDTPLPNNGHSGSYLLRANASSTKEIFGAKTIDRSKLIRRIVLILWTLEEINMEKGQCVQDTLPAMYGIMIAFLTCLVGYALWVSLFISLF